VRKITAILILFGSLGFGAAALANDVTLALQPLEALKAICDKVGGHFTQDSSGYECGTDCQGKPGTACTVFCKAGEKCYAQVIRGRRVHNIEDALKAPGKRGR
jgi:hypothetical protein